jgi:HTH-type transcriptional regulator, sugar sensing transcriptional regulator
MGVPGMQALVDLGLTNLEAEVYVFLLSESPATGYRVASGLGKPAANTYKAIESLAAKGAVVVDEGQSRLCRAVAPAELLARFERDFARQKDVVLESLSRVRGARGDDRVYQLKSPEQVLERCRCMLSEATEVVLADLFPAAVAELRADLQAAAARGLSVSVKVYEPAELMGVEVSLDPAGADTLRRWPGSWLNLVTDGAQHLMAFFTADLSRVHQAVWSGSAYLSWVYHSAFHAEFALAAVAQMLASGAPADEVLRWLDRHRESSGREAPGYRALQSRFGRTTLDRT